MVEQEKVLFKIKKPTREASGKYTIKLSNAQGEDAKDVTITMQAVPQPPQDVAVSEVFQTSCVVAWKTPQDDGGSPIVKYIIERQVRFKIQKDRLFFLGFRQVFTYHVSTYFRICPSKPVGIMWLKYHMVNQRNSRSKTLSQRRRTNSEFVLSTRLVPVSLVFSASPCLLKIHGVRDLFTIFNDNELVPAA